MILDNKGKMFEDRRKENKPVKAGRRAEDKLAKKEETKKNKGITLIALVITIIVMLILVAVTINMSISGSLFRYAAKATGETVIGEEKEIIQRAYSTARMRVLNGQITPRVMQEEMDSIVGLDKNGETKIEVDDNGDETMTITYKETSHYYIIDGRTTEKVEEKPKPTIGAKDITVADYGKTVINYECQDNTIQEGLENANIEWKIVYANEDNVYLIASDYIPLDYVPYARGDTTKNKPANSNTTYPRGASFSNIFAYYQGTDNVVDEGLKGLNSKWHEWLTNNSKKGTNNTAKAIAYMMDQEAWGGFSCAKADYVVGGMPLELLFKSCNKKYNNGNEVYQTRVESQDGYQISKNSGVDWASYYTGMLRTSDNIYIINNTRNATGAWIVSPSASGGDMFRTQSIGKVCDGAATSSDYGFRPVVRLSNTTRLIDNENNTFSIK